MLFSIAELFMIAISWVISIGCMGMVVIFVVGSIVFIILNPVIFLYITGPGVLVTLAYYCMARIEGKNIAKNHPFEDNKRALDGLLSRGAPFVLYLRSHSPEKNVLLEAALNSKMSDELGRAVLTFQPHHENLLESSLLSVFSNRLPVFALETPDDRSIRTANRIQTTKEDWYEVACRLIGQAKFIILSVDGLTNGILREMTFIADFGHTDKTWLVTTAMVLERLDVERPGHSTLYSWKTVRRTDGNSGRTRLISVAPPESLVAALSEYPVREEPIKKSP